ncbi:DNA polymerase III subunit beta, partial [Candidatus Margulisiibacteriota bacterium]
VISAEVKGIGKKNVAFNIRLIIDALRVIDSKEVLLELSTPLSPGIIRPDNNDEYVYIVMPIRTQEAVSA